MSRFLFAGYSRDPTEVFFKETVQSLLDRLTGRDYDKVFQGRKLGQRLEPPKYELLTQAEVDQVMAEMEEKLKKKARAFSLIAIKLREIKILTFFLYC